MSRQHKSRCLHASTMHDTMYPHFYVIQCYVHVITLTRVLPTISRSQIHYYFTVCHDYTSFHADTLLTSAARRDESTAAPPPPTKQINTMQPDAASGDTTQTTSQIRSRACHI